MFNLAKDNKKSSIYESDGYKVKISEINGFFLKKNNSDYVDYDDDLEPDDYKFTKAVKLVITNKLTGKSTSKRCYQGFGVINDVEDDIKAGKKQFKNMFDNID